MRKAFHWLPSAYDSVRLMQLLDVIPTESAVQSFGDSEGQGTCYSLSSPSISADLLFLGHNVVKCVQFALE